MAGGNLDAQTTSDAAGCDFCHIDDVWVDHLPTKNVNNPYRLRINQTTNDFCSACQVTGDSGFDPPGGGLAQGEAVAIAGSNSQTTIANRWGDYSMLSVDRHQR